jgi:hypothetical protein
VNGLLIALGRVLPHVRVPRAASDSKIGDNAFSAALYRAWLRFCSFAMMLLRLPYEMQSSGSTRAY